MCIFSPYIISCFNLGLLYLFGLAYAATHLTFIRNHGLKKSHLYFPAALGFEAFCKKVFFFLNKFE